MPGNSTTTYKTPASTGRITRAKVGVLTPIDSVSETAEDSVITTQSNKSPENKSSVSKISEDGLDESNSLQEDEKKHAEQNEDNSKTPLKNSVALKDPSFLKTPESSKTNNESALKTPESSIANSESNLKTPESTMANFSGLKTPVKHFDDENSETAMEIDVQLKTPVSELKNSQSTTATQGEEQQQKSVDFEDEKPSKYLTKMNLDESSSKNESLSIEEDITKYADSTMGIIYRASLTKSKIPEENIEKSEEQKTVLLSTNKESLFTPEKNLSLASTQFNEGSIASLKSNGKSEEKLSLNGSGLSTSKNFTSLENTLTNETKNTDSEVETCSKKATFEDSLKKESNLEILAHVETLNRNFFENMKFVLTSASRNKKSKNNNFFENCWF